MESAIDCYDLRKGQEGRHSGCGMEKERLKGSTGKLYQTWWAQEGELAEAAFE